MVIIDKKKMLIHRKEEKTDERELSFYRKLFLFLFSRRKFIIQF